MVETTTYELHLLGPWSLHEGGRLRRLQLREQRVLALLGLRGPQPRVSLAGLLWPDSPETRARANLRTSLMRIRRVLGDAVEIRRDDVGLSPSVSVDVDVLREYLDRVEARADEAASEPAATLRVLRCPDLLVGWYDDWVLGEREKLRHRRLRALERLGWQCLTTGRAADSISFAEEAVELEPLLETAVSLHIGALLVDGNLTAALREYRAFSERLRVELGVRPPAALGDMVRAAKAERAGPATSRDAPAPAERGPHRAPSGVRGQAAGP